MGYWVRSGEFVFVAILGGAAYAVGAFVGAFVFEFMKLYAAALLTGHHGSCYWVSSLIVDHLPRARRALRPVCAVPSETARDGRNGEAANDEAGDGSSVRTRGCRCASAAWSLPTPSTSSCAKANGWLSSVSNGAGKTTFINICTGYLKPSSRHGLLRRP